MFCLELLNGVSVPEYRSAVTRLVQSLNAELMDEFIGEVAPPAAHRYRDLVIVARAHQLVPCDLQADAVWLVAR